MYLLPITARTSPVEAIFSSMLNFKTTLATIPPFVLYSISEIQPQLFVTVYLLLEISYSRLSVLNFLFTLLAIKDFSSAMLLKI